MSTNTASQRAVHQPSRSRDTVARRFARTTIAILVILLAVGATATVALVRSSDSFNRLSSGYGPASEANEAALTYMLDAETGIRGYAITGRTTSLQPYRQALRKITPALDAAGAALAGIKDHSLDGDLAGEGRLADTWINDVAHPAVVSQAAAQRASQTSAAKARFDDFRAANATVSARLDRTRATLRDDTKKQRTILLPIVIIGAILGLLLSGLIALRTARGVSRPLTAVSDVVQRLEDGDLTARADESLGPAEVREVSAAINSLAVERRRALAAERADDALRRETRGLTSAIRIGQDPQAIARTLVGGLGGVFDVDRVWLYTFDDARVPALAEQWTRGGASALAEPAAGRGALPGLANRLWHSASVIGIPDHKHLADNVDPHVAVTPQAQQVRASAIAALGEGKTAFGLLWIAGVDQPRSWTATELGLLQHVAAELAQNLVQSHVLVRQREAMRRLREADEAKSALVSTVSHELRTPLTSIIGYLDLLLEMHPVETPGEVAEMLRVIERNATRLRLLIDDLLTQSQIEAGRRLVALGRIDVGEVLREVVESIAPLADSAALQLDFDRPPAGQLMVEGDARQIGQAISNLVANAVKFTPAGGRVTVVAELDGAHAVIRISDTGIGIPAAEVPHLFERFFRASNARSAVIPGTGLGLGIVAEIVAQHHGTVLVESEVNAGTSFVIRLPIAASAAASAAGRAPAAGTVEHG